MEYDVRRGTGTISRADASIDEGLRAYMIKVYNYMAIGLALTGIAALGMANLATTTDPSQAVAQFNNGILLTSIGAAIYGSPLQWVVMLAPLGLVFFLSFRVHKMSVGAAQATFWVYAALVGVSLSSIFLIYTAESITRVFFISAASFGALSLYGYTTKRDLTGMGSFLFMGLIGLIVASIVNIFLGSSALAFAISAVGVLVFAGLTAYDTQKIKEMYYEGDDATTA
ncbi:MAG: Bax inhibitor-1/YccA family protein, partial [Hyphomicrobiaceae bacterium]|nr:Bax inhibitor-1/YccA family protein [Hyphomicrobiaceae bacterium]